MFMNKNGAEFLARLSLLPQNSFENTFSKLCSRMGLAVVLNGDELKLLYSAALIADVCNIALNGLSSSGGCLEAAREADRTMVEIQFMAARDRFFASPGWSRLPAAQRGTIQRTLLRVEVRPEKLAAQ